MLPWQAWSHILWSIVQKCLEPSFRECHDEVGFTIVNRAGHEVFKEAAKQSR